MNKTQPQSHAEREQCIAAIRAWWALPEADPDALRLSHAIIDLPMTGYETSRRGYDQLKALAAQLAAAAAAFDGRFDPTFRRWYVTVRDPDGKLRTAEISTLLGGVLPSDLIDRPYREEVTRSFGLLRQVEERPELRGDATALAELTQLVTEFEPVVTNYEQAQRNKLAGGARFVAATEEFDQAYSKLCRRLNGLLGEEQVRLILPRFVRKNRHEGGGE